MNQRQNEMVGNMENSLGESSNCSKNLWQLTKEVVEDLSLSYPKLKFDG